MTKKLIGLYNVKNLLNKDYTTEQIGKAIYEDMMKKGKSKK